MSTILIATDGSKAAEEAAETALDIAEATGDSVVFVCVWEAIRSAFGIPWSMVDQRYVDEDRVRAEDVLRACRQEAADRGIPCTTLLLEGRPAEVICREAAARNAELLVIGSHGWGSVRGYMFGSVVSEVVQHAPCAVLLGPHGTREWAASHDLNVLTNEGD